MTVEIVPRRVSYTANGISTSFAVPFQFFEIAVYVDDELVLEGADYTITQERPGSTGAVEFSVTPASGVNVLVVGSTKIVQPSDYVENDPYPVEAHEDSLDRLTMVAQELSEKIDASGSLPEEEASIVSATGPGSYIVTVYGGKQYLVPANLFLASSSDPTGIGRGHNVGDIMYHAFPEAPLGWVWLKNERQWVNKADYPEYDAKCAAAGYPYGSSPTQVAIPAAADFIRAWHPDNTSDPDRDTRTSNDGTGTVVGNIIGARQADQFEEHDHGPGTLAGTINGTAGSAGAHAHTASVPNTGSTASETNNDGSQPAGRNSSTVSTNSAGAHTHPVTGTCDVDSGTTADTGGAETRPANTQFPVIMLIRPGDAAARHCTLGIPFNWDTGTTDADPGSGDVRANHATLSSATFLYFSNEQAFGADVTALFDAFNSNITSPRGYITIYNSGQPANAAYFDVSGAVVLEDDYFKVPVVYVGGNGTFTAGTPLSVQPSFAGPPGLAPHTHDFSEIEGLEDVVGTLVNTAVETNAYLLKPGDVIIGVNDAARTGTLICDGSAVSRDTYAALFAAIGTRYGVGDGATTFNLPNYSGEFLRGWSNGSGHDPDAATRTDRGDGTTGNFVGTKQADELKEHSHVNRISLLGTAGTNRYTIQNFNGGTTQYSGSLFGGLETRPRNVSVLFCIVY